MANQLNQLNAHVDTNQSDRLGHNSGDGERQVNNNSVVSQNVGENRHRYSSTSSNNNNHRNIFDVNRHTNSRRRHFGGFYFGSSWTALNWDRKKINMGVLRPYRTEKFQTIADVNKNNDYCDTIDGNNGNCNKENIITEREALERLFRIRATVVTKTVDKRSDTSSIHNKKKDTSNKDN